MVDVGLDQQAGLAGDVYKRPILGLPPEQFVCVGDQVFRDIRGANSAGLDSILVDFIRLPGETHYGKKRVLEKVILWFYHRDPRRRGRLDGIGK